MHIKIALNSLRHIQYMEGMIDIPDQCVQIEIPNIY